MPTQVHEFKVLKTYYDIIRQLDAKKSCFLTFEFMCEGRLFVENFGGSRFARQEYLAYRKAYHDWRRGSAGGARGELTAEALEHQALNDDGAAAQGVGPPGNDHDSVRGMGEATSSIRILAQVRLQQRLHSNVGNSVQVRVKHKDIKKYY